MSIRSELRKMPTRVATLILGPIYLLPSLVLLAFRIEFIWTRLPDRIGHLCVDIDAYLKDMHLGRRPWRRPVYLETKKPANRVLLNYWGRYVRLVTHPFAVTLLRPFMLFPYLVADLRKYATVRNKAAQAFAIYAAWDKRPPLLRLTEDHVARGEAALREMGVPEGAWFVCLHSRDPGYAVHDDHLNDYRNCSIETYRLAASEIVARGGWCIRVGDPSAPRLAPMAGVIDYSHSRFKSEWMDVFLCARCRFFLGNSSGLVLLSTVFGVPYALAHVAPMDCACALTQNDLTIFKLVSNGNGRLINMREAFRSSAASLRFTNEIEAAGIRLVDNTAEQIRDLAVEMIDRIDGRVSYNEQDELLQREFRSLVLPRHYSYGGAGGIGRDFLRQHADLLAEPAATAGPIINRSAETQGSTDSRPSLKTAR